MPTVKYQIFVSSTYVDLKDERDQVIKATLEMGHIPVGMEMFSAADEEQWKIITRQIDQSDYYVVIVAHRYGSMVRRTSYTEKEYDYAVKQGIPVIGFLIDDSAPWPSDRMETDEQKRRLLTKFKDKIKRKPVDFWSSSTDLHGKFAIALGKLINTSPRPGWIRTTEAAGPEVLTELSRLSSENAELRDQIFAAKQANELLNNLAPAKPELRIVFDNNSSDMNLTSSDWLKPFHVTVPPYFSPIHLSGRRTEPKPQPEKHLVTPPPRTAKITIKVTNTGTCSATALIIQLLSNSVTFSQGHFVDDTNPLSSKGGLISSVKNGSTTITCPKLLHSGECSVVFWATFQPTDRFATVDWQCHAENMPVNTQGSLTIRIEDEGVSSSSL